MLGIFDSGFGGLTVLRAIRERLPDLSVMYLGDSARTPYGNRDRETVTHYTKECCSFLFDQGCTLIVLACNTASAETLRELQQEWLPELHRDGKKRNIIGVVRPLAEEAVLHTRNKRIGVVGTRSTIDSGTYIEELKAQKEDVTVLQKACPLLVPLVEEGWERKPEARKILRTYLASLKTENPDVLILGCTHYETLHPLFQEMMGRRCAVLHSPSVIAEKLEAYLERHPEYDIQKTGESSFLTTGAEESFLSLGSRFYGQSISNVQKVEIPALSLAK